MTGLSSDEWVVPPQLGSAEPPPLLVALPEDFAGDAADAAQEVIYLLSHAANVFGLLHDCVSGGYFDSEDNRLGSLSELCARAFRHATEKEGKVLDELSHRVRRSVAARLNDRREADQHRQPQEANHDDHE